jgi:hypothetical protein
MTESTPASRALAGARAMDEISAEILRSQRESLLKSIFNAANSSKLTNGFLNKATRLSISPRPSDGWLNWHLR